MTEAASIGLLCLIPFFFGMPITLGLSLGFILGAVSPAVVVGGMFALQRAGYGVDQGIPSLVVAAASFDDVLAITGYSVAIGLALGEGELYLNILHGPITVIGGIILGFCVAAILSITKIWNTPLKKALCLLSVIVMTTYGLEHVHYEGLGYLGCVMTGLITNFAWKKGTPKWGSIGPEPHASHEVEHVLAGVWRILAMPLLFAVIGASLDFKVLNPSTIPTSILLVFLGVVIRCSVAFLILWGNGFYLKEKIFIALSWMPKATVQAALGTAPLSAILKIYPDRDNPEHAKWIKWGEDILTTAIFSVILTAPLGLIIVSNMGQKVLRKATNKSMRDTLRSIRSLNRDSMIEPVHLSLADCAPGKPGVAFAVTENEKYRSVRSIGRSMRDITYGENDDNVALRPRAVGQFNQSAFGGAKDMSRRSIRPKNELEFFETVVSTVMKLSKELKTLNIIIIYLSNIKTNNNIDVSDDLKNKINSDLTSSESKAVKDKINNYTTLTTPEERFNTIDDILLSTSKIIDNMNTNVKKTLGSLLVETEVAAQQQIQDDKKVVYKDADTAGNFFALVKAAQNEGIHARAPPESVHNSTRSIDIVV
eukprot:GHVR01058586.1.p1 GENE.GHVR01058586.1~~GHVR01058586.1.p1  ORF type:complete len:595 (+),score=140.75 GHVR01058586.1:170-1954(+)